MKKAQIGLAVFNSLLTLIMAIICVRIDVDAWKDAIEAE